MSEEIEKCRLRVDRYYKEGIQDIVFKGKWYSTILELDLRDAFRGRPYKIAGLAKRISIALVATLDFSESWSEYFRKAVTQIMKN